MCRIVRKIKISGPRSSHIHLLSPVITFIKPLHVYLLYFFADVATSASPQIFGWLTGAGEGIRIRAPEDVQERYKACLVSILMNFKRLQWGGRMKKPHPLWDEA